MSTNHFRNECCHGVLVSQCRCASKDKTINVVPCPTHCRLGQAVPADDMTSLIAEGATILEGILAERDELRAEVARLRDLTEADTTSIYAEAAALRSEVTRLTALVGTWKHNHDDQVRRKREAQRLLREALAAINGISEQDPTLPALHVTHGTEPTEGWPRG